MVFRNEGDVRLWVKKFAPVVWWVENKHGGTAGFPDAVVSWGPGRVWFLELKLLKVDRGGQEWIEAAPAQVNVLGELADRGLFAGVLAGVENAEVVRYIAQKDVVRRGRSAGLGRRVRYDVARSVEVGGTEFWRQ